MSASRYAADDAHTRAREARRFVPLCSFFLTVCRARARLLWGGGVDMSRQAEGVAFKTVLVTRGNLTRRPPSARGLKQRAESWSGTAVGPETSSSCRSREISDRAGKCPYRSEPSRAVWPGSALGACVRLENLDRTVRWSLKSVVRARDIFRKINKSELWFAFLFRTRSLGERRRSGELQVSWQRSSKFSSGVFRKHFHPTRVGKDTWPTFKISHQVLLPD